MSYPMQIAMIFLCGTVAGLLYFSGLMLTIWWVRSARRPGLFLMSSFILRAAFVLAVFFAVSDGQWQKFGACLIGFIIARQIMVMLLRPARSVNGRETEVRQWKF